MNSTNKTTLSQLAVQYGGCSLTGARDENQDAFLVKSPTNKGERDNKGVVVCIADGVSCSNQSQQASHTATMQFISDYYATPNSWDVKHSASKIISTLNSWLFEQGTKQSFTHNSLVSTFSTVIIKSNTAHVLHVGDTRVYHIRNNAIQLLTRDHQRTNFGKAAYLTRALGMDSSLEVDYQTISLQENDKFLLTTDGVHDFIDQSELLDISSQHHDLEHLCQTICQKALENKSLDNVSSLLLTIDSLPKHDLLEHQYLALSQTIPPALEVGHKLDDYRVTKVLYAGSRSHVYRVTDERADTEMVMKVPSVHYSEDRTFLTSFANESWVGSQIDSRLIMRTFSTPKQSKFVYQLCEHIEGTTLRQWMYDNPRPSLHTVRNITDQLIKALRVFQRAGMVHRDLKPENIMVTETGEIKIIDFGAVKVQALQDLNRKFQDNIPLGALNYIAPEYIDTGDATTVSDLFSIAVITYEMLAGELPYKAITNQNLHSAKHINWNYRALNQYRNDLPQWVNLALKKATHPLPAKRYQVLSEFMVDLFTPNKSLTDEYQDNPLLKRNPIMFWKLAALLACGVAILEFLVIISN